VSLAEKWEEYRTAQEQKFTDGGPIEKLFEQALQRAFYAGAEAATPESIPINPIQISREMYAKYKTEPTPDMAIVFTLCRIEEILRAEIDHFRSHK
jgi:hypothetical protein